MLNKTQLGTFAQREFRQRHDVIFINPWHHHGVNLDWIKTSFDGGIDSFEHAIEPVTPGQLHIALLVDGIERNIDAI